MPQNEAKRLFIAYQSLHQIYKERADAYRLQRGEKVQVYSDGLARLALSKADYYEGMLR